MTHDEEKKVADIIAEMAGAIKSLQRENEELRGELAHETSHRQKLQNALAYWMPGVTEEIEIGTNGRCGDDALLLVGSEGPFEDKCWGNEAIARAEAAEAEVKRLETELALSKPVYSRRQIEARVKVLEAALKPFAEYMGDHFDKDNHGDPLPDDLGVGWIYLTHADFRRARTALASREGDTHKPVAYVCAADMELLGKSSDGWDFSMSPKPRPDLGMNMALYAAPLTETSKPDPVLWVSPVDLRAWQKAKAGEIWAWSENLEGECIPLYTVLASTGGEHHAE